MNIFFLSMNPKIAAMWHCDKHVVKMIIESAQLLCCIHWLAREASDPSLIAKKNTSPKKQKPAVASPPSTPTPTINTNDAVVQSSEVKDKIPYKKSHAHHPMVGWIQASLANYNWCLDLGLYLSDEYTHRYNKIHKTKACLEWLSEHKPELPNVGFTNPPLCMPEPYKNTEDFVESYRQYYIHDKRRFARWTKRDVPEWFTEGVAKLEEQEKQEQKDNPESAEEAAAAAPKAKKSPKKKSPAKPKVKAESSSTTPQPPTRERLSRKAKTDAQQKMDQSQDVESDDGDTVQYRKRKSTTSPNNKNRKKAKL